jgi:hypothetical protein
MTQRDRASNGTRQICAILTVVNRFVTLLATVATLSPSVGAYDDLTILSDEFDAAHTVTNWQRIHQVESWSNVVLQQFDFNTSRPGRMTMVPYTSSWYAEWRGELTFKLVTGDFVITTDVEPRNRAGTGAPGSQYSLAGIMVRAPRTMTSPAQWTSGGQNYVFLSLGAASNPGAYQYEVKTTSNSVSTLQISSGVSRASIQVARLGAHLIMLRRDQGGGWQVHRRYFRPDLPATLQAGLTVYTDWPVCEAVGFQYQNQFVLTNGLRLPNGTVVSGCNPDLVAAFDYVRYARPAVPANLAGANFSGAAVVSDVQLLSFLGELANVPGGAGAAPSLTSPAHSQTGFSAGINVMSNRSYRVQASTDFISWITLTNFVSAGSNALFNDAALLPGFRRFYRATSP